jgi:calcium/calmodulin-dependent protein kinase I
MGVVHRDIKPENLLLTAKELEKGVVKISDFGFARFLQSDELANTRCGTPGYVAPEIVMGNPYKGEPSDFWSCGVVLYIMLSGEPPFFHEDTFELYELIKKCAYNFDSPIWK